MVANPKDVGEADQVQCESQGIVVHGKMVGWGVCRPRQAADIVVVRGDGVSVVPDHCEELHLYGMDLGRQDEENVFKAGGRLRDVDSYSNSAGRFLRSCANPKALQTV